MELRGAEGEGLEGGRVPVVLVADTTVAMTVHVVAELGYDAVIAA